jgi:predicted PurR-regulated permease PerM
MFALFRAPHHKTQEVSVTISTGTVIRVLTLMALAVLFVSALRSASHELVLIFTAFFFALALNTPVHWLGRHLPGRLKGSRTTATAISFLLIIAVLGAFLATIIPPLVKQTKAFVSAAPGIVSSARDPNTEIGKFVHRYNLEKRIDSFSQQLSSHLNNIGGEAFSTASKVGSSIFSVLTILVLTFMMLIEGPRWFDFAYELMPKERRKHAKELASDMYRVIRGFVNGQVILAAIASVMIFPALLILHVSYAVALLVVVFICGLIPLVGHTIGAIIVTLVALAHSPWHALILLAYYILYQQIENYVIQPRIQSNSTDISPLTVFTSVILGVSFGGLVGGLVAIPVAGSLRILLLDYLHNHEYLGDKPTVEREVEVAHANTKA